MKKIITLCLLLIISMFICTSVNAKTETTDLEETLKAENITLSSDYEEKDDQVTLYLFRGEGCSHCQELLNYLNSIVKKHGNKFKLRAYEVWNNEDNNELKDLAAEELSIKADGVPFLIIGKNTFLGFGEKDKAKILDSINKEYKKKVEDRYDVIDKVNAKQKNKKSDNSALIIIIPVIVLGIIIFLTRRPEEQN